MLREKTINWAEISVVIFDIDGTLYNQQALCRRMFIETAAYCLRNPLRIKELKILCDFRRERRKRAGMTVDNLQDTQYIWGAEASRISPEDERRIVDRWLFQRPMRHLLSCRREGVETFIEDLHSKGIRTAVYSDYPAKEKMKALDLPNTAEFSSVDKNISCLKPNPKGLLAIVEAFEVSVDQCVFIGDRDELDGECARRAGMKYLILERNRSGVGQSFPVLPAHLFRIQQFFRLKSDYKNPESLIRIASLVWQQNSTIIVNQKETLQTITDVSLLVIRYDATSSNS